MKYLLTLFLCIAIIPANAAIYQQVDSSGQITYSDQPLEQNAEKIDTHNNTGQIKSAPVTETAPAAEKTANAAAPHLYQIFQIAAPKDQDTIQNQRNIAIEIKIDPALQTGDTIQLFLDNKPWGAASSSTQMELANVERGVHQVSAALLDSNNQILKRSNTITIYVHLASTFFNRKPQ